MRNDLTVAVPAYAKQVDTHPGFEEILSPSHDHLEPWIPENFLRFLQSEFCEENLWFYSEMSYLKSSLDTTLPPSVDTARIDTAVLTREIVKQFIESNGEYSVNVSHEQREQILTHQNQEQLRALEDAQLEVKKLLLRGPWPRFYNKMMRENLSVSITKGRYIQAAVIYVFVLAAWITLLVLGNEIVPRWYVFVLLVPLLLANFFFVSAWYRLCPVMSHLGRRFASVTGGGEVAVACPFVRKANRVRGYQVNATIVLLSVVQILIAFAMTYI
ncbi:hypothetical protein BASA81_010258 [Batrachochytrium salamandrivorans]|nr:hypothetical protein BASA81_010258 [Batrachochytrium salamandrivorans]